MTDRNSHERLVVEFYAARWSASRGSTHVSGNEIAVYRVENQKIAEAWFHIDGHDPQALNTVFTAP